MKFRPALRWIFAFIFCLYLSVFSARAQWKPRNPVTSFQRQADSVVFTQREGFLKLQVCSDDVIHVLYSPSAAFEEHPNFVVTKTKWQTPQWTMQDTPDEITITTGRLKVSVARIDGAITYKEAGGASLVQDANRWLTPVKVNGEDTYRAESFVNIYGSYEGFYGLGQHQAGVWNYRGESVDISQDNTNISIPFLVSSKGYGIYWNNESR